MKPTPAPTDLVEALDLISDTRGLLELLALACRNSPGDDRHALDTGIAAALDRLTQAESLIQAQATPAPLKAA